MSNVSIELEKWWDEYKPVPNHFHSDDTEEDPSLVYFFETYGRELDYVRSEIHACNVWTWVDGDEGSYLVAGYHLVNRIGYFITEKQWDDKDLVITYDTYERPSAKIQKKSIINNLLLLVRRWRMSW